MKKTAKFLLILLAVLTLCLCGISAGATSDDPADSYTKQTAEYEDSSIDLWFDYSFRKTLTEDKTSTGMDTFSIYMAKNEIESAQFVLYSDTDKTGMSATVTEFTDGKGNTIPAEIYYQFYVTVENVNSQTVWGENFIREGETPDPVVPLSKVKTFKLNAGKSQAFLIRAKSATDTAPGWYSAQLNVMDADKHTVKTATVYCHVWDFEISEKTELKTAFYMNNDVTYQGNYQAFYDYFLENRLNAMDVPGGRPTATNSYLTNPRVTAFRMSHTGLGSRGGGTYMEVSPSDFSQYKAIYNEFATSPVWDQIKDKIYFYATDEPLPYDLVGNSRQNVDQAKYNTAAIRTNWGDDINSVVTPTEDHAYPYSTFTRPLDTYPQEMLKDCDQELMDTESMTILCPSLYSFTPYYELLEYGNVTGTVPFGANPYAENFTCIKNKSNGGYSGYYGILGQSGAPGFYDWEAMYGEIYDRYMSHIAKVNNSGKYSNKYEMWTYSAGYNSSYTYPNHVIENTGLQTKMLFWQLYQNDITGYLYYGTNNWRESSNPVSDKTVTGAKTNCTWYANRYTFPVGDGVKYVYGNGVLFYGPSMGRISGVDVIGSLRVELMRDGVEEYQMLKMLEDLKGENRAKEVVGSVSTNVVRYLTLSGFDRSAFDPAMDEYDIMESVRRSLGNEVEAATLAGRCDHKWDDGTVTKEEGCVTVGETTYTCTECGAKRTETIPTKHEMGECFTKVSGNAATCTTAGSEVYECDLCGFRKTVKSYAYHDDESILIPQYKNETMHSLICPTCGQAAVNKAHLMFEHKIWPTCTEDGRYYSSCSVCDYEIEKETYPATGHNYIDGFCTNCGEAEPEPEYTLGDLNGDKEITAIDSNLLKKTVAGTVSLGETEKKAADVSGDGEVTAIDANLMTKFVAGAISVFPAAVK